MNKVSFKKFINIIFDTGRIILGKQVKCILISKCFNSFAEKALIGHFCLYAILLVTRDFGTYGGWAIIFKDGY